MGHNTSFPNPPGWVDRLLDRWLDPYLGEGIKGDLYERYLTTYQDRGRRRANWEYFLNGMGYLRYARLRNKNSKSNWQAMLKNHLTITLRTFKKHKVYSLINTLGLAIGMAAGFMILQYVHYEFTYDRFLENSQNIYRVKQNRYNKGELTTQWAAGCSGVGNAMKSDLPEVNKYVKLTLSTTMLSYDQRYFKVPHAYYASEDFFEIFSVPLLSGIDSLVLDNPYTVVLSKSLAKKIFGNDNPIGKVLKLNDTWDFEVTGIFDDLPEHTHMRFDLLYSFKSFVDIQGEQADTQWNWDGFMTYVQLEEGTDPGVVENKLVDLTEKYNGEELRLYNSAQSFELQPLDKIHLTSNYIREFKENGNEQATYFLLIVGVFVLLIAWINYINLSTARSMQRAKEVGVRKVIGSAKSQLISQFIFESFLTNLISLVLALALVVYIYPYFNGFVGREAQYTLPNDALFWLAMVGTIVVGALISGFYPAMVMSQFKPIKVLNGKFETSSSGSLLRKILVIFQFVTSVVLITGTFVIYQQLEFLQKQELGVSINKTMVIRTPVINADSIYRGRYDVFRNNLLNEAQIMQVSSTNTVPGRRADWNAGGIRLLQQTEADANQYRVIAMDDEFIDLFGLQVIEGRAFSASYGTETSSVIVNEAAVPLLGAMSAKDLINQKMYFWDDTFNIVGVVKNFRQESPKAAYDPMVFRYFPAPTGFYALKISSNDIPSLITKIETHWMDAYYGQPFNFFFLDDYYNEQYDSENRFGSIFAGFAGLAIFVACMGLFGLASYATSLRTKEVSVRKVLGANFPQLFLLLTSDFMKLVFIAILFSIPFSWWTLDTWLQEFANRITLDWWLFVVPAGVLILIAVATIGYHTFKVVSVNPARTLKYE